MLTNFENATNLINQGKLLHIAGTEALLKKLPKGNWIGGSTEYFMTSEGGKISADSLFVTTFPYENFSIKSYSADEIKNVARDTFDSGFSIVIVPFDSAAHKEYAQNAAGYDDMFIKNVAGWVAGVNLNKPEQTPITVNGKSGEIYSDRAAVLHLEVPADKTVGINIINIFTQDENSPVIEFTKEGFSIETCLVDGKEVVFADYIKQNNLNIKLPLVGDYSGNGVNISLKSIENGAVQLYAPVFSNIKYRFAKNISDYRQEFHNRLVGITDTEAVFSCNCILNFLYGELEGKKIEAFNGPITFGEIAYQLLNQTLVCVTVL
jgi:hypothetical protein